MKTAAKILFILSVLGSILMMVIFVPMINHFIQNPEEFLQQAGSEAAQLTAEQVVQALSMIKTIVIGAGVISLLNGIYGSIALFIAKSKKAVILPGILALILNGLIVGIITLCIPESDFVSGEVE